MVDYTPDIDPGQVVHWLLDAQRRHAERLSVRATRQYVAQRATRPEMEHFGDEEAEELSEVTAVGLLEVEPPAGSDGWVLRVRIEDELGPRLPEDEPAPAEAEEIDLADFEADFVVPGRGTIEVTAEVEGSNGKRRLDRLLEKIRKDRHTKRPA